MDLHLWMLADLAAARTKLLDSVATMIPQDRWLERADGGGSTITHLLLHIARHQDLAVNCVVRGHDALYLAHRDVLGLAEAPLGAGLAEREDPSISALADPGAVLDFVGSTFDATAAWLSEPDSIGLETVPDASHGLTRHGHLEQADLSWLYAMWNDRPNWWFIQWPVIGHANAHVGEGISIRNRMGLSPF